MPPFKPSPPEPPRPTRREGRCAGCGAEIEQCGFDAHPVATADATTSCPAGREGSRHVFADPADPEPVVG